MTICKYYILVIKASVIDTVQCRVNIQNIRGVFLIWTASKMEILLLLIDIDLF